MGYKEEVKLIKALADENRLAILEMLQKEEKCACYILEELDISQPTLSHHMKILCESGLVDSCKDGKWMHYSLSFEGCKKLRA
ncbi:MAG: metalloregulator ArsR/SmtB family transcription factor, partial [Firmicutes bacterium]|nr:metalloregulator ArsR/SmtB family transcription factor [Bacillota bacterium]